MLVKEYKDTKWEIKNHPIFLISIKTLSKWGFNSHLYSLHSTFAVNAYCYDPSASSDISSTCINSRSSTLVSRPKIDTKTLKRPLS
jgi:hypothetical protein